MHVAEAIDEMANTLEKRKTERDTTELELHTALKEKEILLKEVHHRVKNNLQIINSILHLEKKQHHRSAGVRRTAGKQDSCHFQCP